MIIAVIPSYMGLNFVKAAKKAIIYRQNHGKNQRTRLTFTTWSTFAPETSRRFCGCAGHRYCNVQVTGPTKAWQIYGFHYPIDLPRPILILEQIFFFTAILFCLLGLVIATIFCSQQEYSHLSTSNRVLRTVYGRIGGRATAFGNFFAVKLLDPPSGPI